MCLVSGYMSAKTVIKIFRTLTILTEVLSGLLEAEDEMIKQFH